MTRSIEVTMTFRADVSDVRSDHGQTVVDGYGPHELADAVRFHVGLSDLDSIEADISAFEMLDARETPRPIRPGDLVTHRRHTHLDAREVVTVGRDFLTLDIMGVETERVPLDNYVLDTPADGVL